MSTALITGATAGIGHAFARQLAARGDDVVLVARDVERLERVAVELREAYAVRAEVLPADLGDRAQLGAVEERLRDERSPVDLLVNNAGFGLKKRILDNSADEETAMLEVLVTAPLRLSHAALGAQAGRGHGGVINVGSVASLLPRGTYSAAKAWINAFTEWAHHEYEPRGVTVMALLPGFTKTEFHERMGVSRGSAPDWMWLDVDDLVREALADFDKGKVYSVPSVQYKLITTAARAVPTRLLQRFQGLGRR